MQKKVEGQEITMAEAPEGGAQVIDLMEALRASLEKKGGAGDGRQTQTAEPQPETRKPPKRAAGRRRGRDAQERQEIARADRSDVMHPYGVRDVEKLLAPAAQHDPRAGRRRIRVARARTAQRLAVLVPGPDRAAHRAGARGGEGAAAAHHASR